jgi:isoamyl acetate esterase
VVEIRLRIPFAVVRRIFLRKSKQALKQGRFTMLQKCFALLFLATVLLTGCSDEAPDAPDPLKDVERIVFFGDSITQAGAEPGGYVQIISDSLAARYPDKEIEVIGAGISGNKVPDLQARLEQDVLAHDPTTVVIYIGINDVWHWQNFSGQGTTTEDFDSGLRAIVDTLQTSGARVLLCTPSMIGEKHDGTNPQDAMLDEYADISRSVAQDLGAETCDLRADFVEYLGEHNTTNAEQGVLTTDGVHLNDAGNQFVADRILRALERRDP